MAKVNGIIRLLNVGDADAIIASIDRGEESLIMVVDGGKPGDYLQKVKPALAGLLEQKKKKGPDIVVATHYDSDHIGGLIPLITDYIDHVSEVWVHRSPELLQQFTALDTAIKDKKYIKSRELFEFETELRDMGTIAGNSIATKKDFIFESLRQLDTFLGKIPKEKLRQVFYGYSPEGWEDEVKVLGPTKDFYHSLFPAGSTLGTLILQEAASNFTLPSSDVMRFYEVLGEPKSACELLKTDGTAQLTPTNKASIIIALDTDKGRSLLTGDAGIASFKNIPDWEASLGGLYFLKIPHHGSDNNISKQIIDVMQPKFAYCSGDRHQDSTVLDCIGRHTSEAPKSTKTGADLTIEI